jgi:membrane-associated protease RseP (regulator of RpoE activity)
VEGWESRTARQYGVARNTQGVVVRRVDPDSAAAQAGLQTGDVILEVNRQPVSTVDQVNSYINEGTSETALLFVNHDGRTRYVVTPVSNPFIGRVDPTESTPHPCQMTRPRLSSGSWFVQLHYRQEVLPRTAEIQSMPRRTALILRVSQRWPARLVLSSFPQEPPLVYC